MVRNVVVFNCIVLVFNIFYICISSDILPDADATEQRHTEYEGRRIQHGGQSVM